MTMAAKAVRSAQATTCFVAPSMRNYEVFSKRIFALESHDHVVNGKSALEWVMERQCVKTDPASGIVNDANAYANETVADPTYPFALFCRVITISLETIRIVRSLPSLDILDLVTAASVTPTGASEIEPAMEDV